MSLGFWGRVARARAGLFSAPPLLCSPCGPLLARLRSRPRVRPENTTPAAAQPRGAAVQVGRRPRDDVRGQRARALPVDRPADRQGANAKRQTHRDTHAQAYGARPSLAAPAPGIGGARPAPSLPSNTLSPSPPRLGEFSWLTPLAHRCPLGRPQVTSQVIVTSSISAASSIDLGNLQQERGYRWAPPVCMSCSCPGCCVCTQDGGWVEFAGSWLVLVRVVW